MCPFCGEPLCDICKCKKTVNPSEHTKRSGKELENEVLDILYDIILTKNTPIGRMMRNGGAGDRLLCDAARGDKNAFRIALHLVCLNYWAERYSGEIL